MSRLVKPGRKQKKLTRRMRKPRSRISRGTCMRWVTWIQTTTRQSCGASSRPGTPTRLATRRFPSASSTCCVLTSSGTRSGRMERMWVMTLGWTKKMVKPPLLDLLLLGQMMASSWPLRGRRRAMRRPQAGRAHGLKSLRRRCRRPERQSRLARRPSLTTGCREQARRALRTRGIRSTLRGSSRSERKRLHRCGLWTRSWQCGTCKRPSWSW
mmetsp:Transcript_94767/g.219963  ORF Transcript_94767/g.219963 Transcript_94767/m.219963 type:complete len:212 (-) Transcript_94767:959-1594(-)